MGACLYPSQPNPYVPGLKRNEALEEARKYVTKRSKKRIGHTTDPRGALEATQEMQAKDIVNVWWKHRGSS